MAELIEPIEFFKIDKVSDDVYAIGPNLLLKFNVSLSKISNGKRHHFHKEFEYPSKSVQNQPTLVTIKRSFDYYLSIENMQKDANGNKVFIRIGPQEHILVRQGLETAISWFTDSRYSKLFARDNGKLIMMPPIPSTRISSLPLQKYIEISPIILDKGMANADKETGVRIELGDPSIYIDINLDRLMGLYYTIASFNMYQAAITVLNYVQRPEFGTNRVVLGNLYSVIPEMDSEYTVSGIEGRVVTPRDAANNISLLEG